MPKAPPKPCREYGCPRTAERDGFCDDHWRPRWSGHERGPAIYDTAAWKRARKMFLRRYPVCTRKKPDGRACGRPATVPHHIVPVKEGGDVFDFENMVPRCRGCHEIEHGRKYE